MSSGPVICHISFNHSPLDDRIYWKELLSLQQAGYQTVHIAVGTENADYLTGEGIRVIVVARRIKSKHPWINRFLQFAGTKGTTLEGIWEKAKEVKAVLYQYHDLQLNALSGKLKSLPWKPFVIYDAHEAYHLLLQENGPRMRWLSPVYRLFLKRVQAWEIKGAKRCDYIFVTDPYTLSYFTAKVPKVPVQLLFNYSWFGATAGQQGAKQYDLIYTGLMSKSRGTRELLQAVALLKKRNRSTTLLLIGPFEDPQWEKTIRELIISLDIKDEVQLQEPVPFGQMRKFYETAAIGLGLFHTTPKYSTFIPIKLFEYMAFGLPVVFSNHGPSADIIRTTGCGLLVDPMDPNAAAAAIEQLLLDKSLYHQMQEKARTAIAEKYNWQLEQEKLLSVYKSLLSQHPGAIHQPDQPKSNS